jgi:antitoxin HigA-1
MTKKLEEIHPGEILSEEFLKPLGITNARLAADLDVPTSRISEIVNKHRPITVDTAVRLGVFFNMEARFWLNLQAEYDARIAQTKLLPEIKKRIRPFQFQATPNRKG